MSKCLIVIIVSIIVIILALVCIGIAMNKKSSEQYTPLAADVGELMIHPPPRKIPKTSKTSKTPTSTKYPGTKAPEKRAIKTPNYLQLSPKLSSEDIINLKKGQKKMSEMLKTFDSLCQQHKIRYFLIGGSLIGALAYDGWIPWDGDIDIEVHANDYDKLAQILANELPKTMWYQDSTIDPNYQPHPIKGVIGKIRDLNSCYIEYTNSKNPDARQNHNGLQIDLNMWKETNGKVSFPDNPKVTYLTTSDVYPLRRVPFEDFHVNVMQNSEKYLRRNYGSKWFKDLPINKRYPHEGNIYPDKTCPHHKQKYPHLYVSSPASRKQPP